MIYRLSARLAKKIKEQPDRCHEPHANGFLDWSGHLFYADRKQYILQMNTPSCYAIIYPARGIRDTSDYIQSANEHIIDYLRRDDFDLIAERVIAPKMYNAFFSKALDRSVTGYMNDFIAHARYFLDEMSPFEVSQSLNETPLPKKPFFNPRAGLQKITLET